MSMTPNSIKALNIDPEVKKALLAIIGEDDTVDDAVTVGAAPSVAGLTVDVNRQGNIATLTFNLAAVSVPVTDAAGSGSSGSLKIFDFANFAIQPLASRMDFTAFTEGAALTGAAGDAAFVMGLGSVAANAADGALTGTEVDFAAVTATITLGSTTLPYSKLAGQGTAIDGTSTAVDLYLNWSGSAATIDANSTISVTGTITVILALLGDD